MVMTLEHFSPFRVQGAMRKVGDICNGILLILKILYEVSILEYHTAQGRCKVPRALKGF